MNTTYIKQRGFIAIPILIAIAIGVFALVGTGFAAYKLGQTSSVKETPTTADAVDQDTAISAQTDVQESADNTKNDFSEIDTLKQQVATLQHQVSTQKSTAQKTAEVITKTEATATTSQNNIVSLPNGAVVEMGANGEIIRYITQPVQAQTSTPSIQETSAVDTTPKIEISNVRVTTGITTARLEWTTSKPTTSKVFISSASMLEKAFASESGLSTKHYVDLIGFNIRNDVTYSYDMEAIDSTGNDFVKKSGTFKLLPKPYAELAPAVKSTADFNPKQSCSALFGIPYEYLICVDYRAGI